MLDEGAEPQFLCTQGTLQGGRVEDHRMMFIRHLHLVQSYIQAILHIYKTDYMMCLMTVNILKAPCKIVRKANNETNAQIKFNQW